MEETIEQASGGAAEPIRQGFSERDGLVLLDVVTAFPDKHQLGVGEKAARRVAEMFPNTESVFVGKGRHYIQEDQPVAIGEALSDWLSRTA